MPKLLTEAQVEAYHRDGFVPAIPVLTQAETAAARDAIEAWEAHTGKPLGFPHKSKSYLLFDWADRIAHHPRVLDAVEDLIGPDILLFHATMWIKEPHSPAHVLWHQDGPYFFLDPPLHVTAWVAFTDATEEAGCMRMIPGSHRFGALQHVDKPSEHNMIRRGQGLEGFADGDGTLVPVPAGCMSLHHTNLVHASASNRAAHRRMGFGLSYIPTRCRPTGPSVPGALLVRGEDRFNHFVREQRLDREGSNLSRRLHAEACARFDALQHAGFKAA